MCLSVALNKCMDDSAGFGNLDKSYITRVRPAFQKEKKSDAVNRKTE